MRTEVDGGRGGGGVAVEGGVGGRGGGRKPIKQKKGTEALKK